MAEKILARKRNGPDAYEWLSLSSSSAGGEGNLQDLAEAADGAPVQLIIPASEVLHLQIALPVKSNRQLKQALPYAIEELLAQEVENYHLAWQRLSGNGIAVAAIEQDTLNRYQDACQALGIHLAGLYSALLFVPWQAGTVSIVIEHQQAILRQGEWLGGGVETALLPVLLAKLDQEQLANPLQVWQAPSSAPVTTLDGLAIEQHPISSTLALFAEHLPTKPSLNLLGPNYRSTAAEQPPKWLAWLPTAAMLLLAAALQLAAAFQQTWHQQALLAELEKQNQQSLKQAFPELKRIVNIKAQAQQALASLRKNASPQTNLGYLFLLYKTGEALANTDNLQNVDIQGMDFTNNILSLSLIGTDIAQLDAIKQSLEQTPGLQANIRSAESNDKGVQAHLDISKAAS